MSHTVIITGMHRSGTSLIASILQKSGMSIGDRLLAASKANPRGFFEDLDFYTFHEQALQERDQTLFVANDFVFAPTESEFDQARRLIQAREDQLIWGWKDPRTTLFLEFWHQLLPEAYFLLVYRHPLDVLLSLVRRGDLYSVGLLEGLEAWHIYNTRIKAFYERNRERCLLCHTYSVVDQIDDFDRALKRTFDINLGIDPETLRSLYSPEELRRVPMSAEAEAILNVIYPQALDLYRDLNALADLPQRADFATALATPTLIRLNDFVQSFPPAQALPGSRGALLVLLALISPQVTETFFSEYNSYLKDLERGKAWLDKQYDTWHTEAERRAAQIQEQRAWIERLEEAKIWLEAQHTNWQQIAEEHKLTFQAQQERIAGLEGELARCKSYLQRTRQSRIFRILSRLGLLP